MNINDFFSFCSMYDVIPVQWFWEISLLLEMYIKCTNEEKKKKIQG